MSLRTSHLVVTLRNFGRKIGLNKWISRCLNRARAYEDRYCRQLSACLRDGDCVWDIGANVGYYTRLFAGLVGPGGKVFAFEPSPLNFQRLAEECSSLTNVTLLSVGLGETDGELHLEQGEDDFGATSRLTESEPRGQIISVRSGDSLVSEGTVDVPQVVKIDVEGFECEVLEGMTRLLRESGPRAIGLEVHFGILKERGKEHGPRWIERRVREFGFSVRWTDSNHLLALRDG